MTSIRNKEEIKLFSNQLRVISSKNPVKDEVKKIKSDREINIFNVLVPLIKIRIL